MANQTLLEAAKYIEEHGWTQRIDKDEQGRVCALGAIAEITPNDSDVYELAWRCLRAYLKMPITWWNDEKGRNKEEVIDTMIKAANSCE
jgi:hypothetical protein